MERRQDPPRPDWGSVAKGAEAEAELVSRTLQVLQPVLQGQIVLLRALAGADSGIAVGNDKSATSKRRG